MRGRGRVRATAAAAMAASFVLIAPALGRARVAPTTEPTDPQATIVASVDRRAVTTVESVTLSVRVRADGVEIEGLVPHLAPGEPLGDFTVAWVRREPPDADGDGVIHRWMAGLEPFLPGESRIPAIGVTVAGAAEPIAGIASDPIDIRVSSVLDDAEDFEPARLRPPLDPLPVAGGRRPAALPWVVAGASGVLALGAVGLLVGQKSPGGRVRRALKPMRRRAAVLAASPEMEAADRAVNVLAVVREAAAVLMGERARALTWDEFVGALAERAPGLVKTDLERLGQLGAWHDGVVYARLQGPPPAVPNTMAMLDAIEAAAVSEAGGARPAAAGGAPP